MVKFKKAHGRYGIGDTAVFSPEFEQRLINEGFCEAAKEEPMERKTPPPETKRPEPTGNQNRQTTVPQSKK